MTPASARGSSAGSTVPSGTVLAHPYTDMGWRWLNQRGNGTQHLYPPKPGSRSTSACFRVLVVHALEEPVLGLFCDLPDRCKDCERKNGGPE